MGNIQMEVVPFRRKSRRRKESREVKMISIHHPVSPQRKKFLRKVFMDNPPIRCINNESSL